jgi:ferredoxin-NADP reductase
MVHTNTDIPLIVQSVRPETPGYYSVVFERPRKFMYDAGDWMDVELHGQKLRGGTTYSFSSSPSEPNLMITFREGISPFKQALAGLQPGDSARITQYGNDYGFRLRDNRSSILIAGGVGIAPFRSMLQDVADQAGNDRIQLLYFNQNDDFLFRSKLDTWQQQLPNFAVSYFVTKELRRKNREQVLASTTADKNQHYYIAGPPGMVTSTETALVKLGIGSRNIKIDSFGGY